MKDDRKRLMLLLPADLVARIDSQRKPIGQGVGPMIRQLCDEALKVRERADRREAKAG